MPIRLRGLIYPFFLPGGLLLATTLVLLPRLVVPPAPLKSLFEAAPAGVFVLGALLGWRFNRSRTVFALTALFLAGAFLDLAGKGAAGRLAFDAVALLLPLNLVLISLYAERGLSTPLGLARLGALVLQPAAVLGLYGHLGDRVIAWIETAWLPLPPTLGAGIPLPQAALASFLVAAMGLGRNVLRRPAPLESSLFWSLAAAFFALLAPRGPTGTLLLLAAELIQVAGLLEASHSMAFRDELTGLPGRRALDEALLRAGSRFALAMVDVDHFKRVNDRHGHDVGDQVLRSIAGALTEVGGGGKAYRYGGEEFAVLFPGRGVAEALPHVERLRERIAETPVSLRAGSARKARGGQGLVGRRRGASGGLRRTAAPGLKVTISAGLAERSPRNPDPARVVQAADRALYRAKRAGRDQVRT